MMKKMLTPTKTTTALLGKQGLALRRLCFLAFVPALLASPLRVPQAWASPAKAPGVGELLARVTAAESHASYTATQIIKRGNGPREVTHLWRSGLRKRVEWVEPEVRKGDVLVDDGKTVKLYHRAEKALTETKSAPRVDYTHSIPKAIKDTTFEGRPVYALELSTGALLWVDQETSIRLRLENGWNSMALKDLKVGPISDSRFTFAPPEGTRVTKSAGTLYNTLSAARRAAAWFKQPANLPAGYAFESALVEKTEVWLRYTNGQRRFSLFEQQSGGADVELQKVQNSWFWKTGGVRYLITGAPESEIPALASSIK